MGAAIGFALVQPAWDHLRHLHGIRAGVGDAVHAA